MISLRKMCQLILTMSDLMLMYNDDLRLTHFLKEKYNNKIKVLKRISYGIRNFERLRTRILLTTT